MKKLNTTFILTGGAGRVVCSIPALEKYHRLNPDDDFRVVVHGWDMLFWSHPILQDRVFNAAQKGLFETVFKNNRTVMPEPYHTHEFYNEEISLIEAFDVEINNTSDHSDLKKEGYLYLSRYEIAGAKQYIAEEKQKQNKKYCIMTQPFGSGVNLLNGKPHDDTNRSIEPDDYYDIVKYLEKDSVILYSSSEQFKKNDDKTTVSFEGTHPHLPFFRLMMALISECDYFIGCDSVGQHIARAFGKPGLVLMGATGDKCFSYPDHFEIYRKGIPRYFPWRLAEPDAMFAARYNDGLMEFSEEDMKNIKSIIDKNLKNQTKQSNKITPKPDNSFNYE